LPAVVLLLLLLTACCFNVASAAWSRSQEESYAQDRSVAGR